DLNDILYDHGLPVEKYPAARINIELQRCQRLVVYITEDHRRRAAVKNLLQRVKVARVLRNGRAGHVERRLDQREHATEPEPRIDHVFPREDRLEYVPLIDQIGIGIERSRYLALVAGGDRDRRSDLHSGRNLAEALDQIIC